MVGKGGEFESYDELIWKLREHKPHHIDLQYVVVISNGQSYLGLVDKDRIGAEYKMKIVASKSEGGKAGVEFYSRSKKFSSDTVGRLMYELCMFGEDIKRSINGVKVDI